MLFWAPITSLLQWQSSLGVKIWQWFQLSSSSLPLIIDLESLVSPLRSQSIHSQHGPLCSLWKYVLIPSILTKGLIRKHFGLDGLRLTYFLWNSFSFLIKSTHKPYGIIYIATSWNILPWYFSMRRNIWASWELKQSVGYNAVQTASNSWTPFRCIQMVNIVKRAL